MKIPARCSQWSWIFLWAVAAVNADTEAPKVLNESNVDRTILSDLDMAATQNRLSFIAHWCSDYFPTLLPLSQRPSDHVLSRALAQLLSPMHLSADVHFNIHHVIALNHCSTQTVIPRTLALSRFYPSESAIRASNDIIVLSTRVNKQI